MKKLFIEARRKISLNKEKLSELARNLPDTIYIAYSIQYKTLALEARKYIESCKNKKLAGFSQILGCSQIKTQAEAILLIGEARFHALNLAKSSGKQVVIFDGYSISNISKQEILELQKKDKGKYIKFLAAEKIGILVSGKSGQENLKQAETLKQEIKKKNKQAYLFLTDNINLAELENFQMEIFVNTACPGLALDSGKIINYNSIKTKNGK